MERARPARWSRPAGATLAVGVLTLVLAACSKGSPLFQGGPRSSESTPFEFGGRLVYVLAWTTSAQTPAGCRIVVELATADGDNSVARAEGGTTSGGASQDSQPIPDAAAGSYRLRVNSTCESWTAVVGEDTPGGLALSRRPPRARSAGTPHPARCGCTAAGRDRLRASCAAAPCTRGGSGSPTRTRGPRLAAAGPVR